jgi:hypothetical protein
MMLAIETPLAAFFDLDGSPLDAGRLYFGLPNDNPETAPITVYWDAAGTQPAAQPLRTSNGFIVRSGTPAQVYVSGDYSLTVKNRSGARVAYAPSSLSASNDLDLQLQITTLVADLASTVSGKGAGMIGWKAVNGADRTVEAKLLDTRSVKDDGATGLTADNATAGVQASVNAVLADAQPGHSVYVPDGDYRVNTITVDLTAAVGAGRFSIHGNGDSSQLTMRGTPNTDILSFVGNPGQSFGSSIHDLRFQVGSQGNNVDASAINTGLSSTMLDFQLYNNYVNGMPRGFSGQFVSGMMLNNMFDFMTDYGIWGRSKEFRKLELVANHFYKVKQRSVYIQGELDSSGNPTNIGDRDNGRGAGHFTLTANGFDRLFDNTELHHDFYADQIDNFVVSANWHNGKTPDSTDYPLDALRIVGARRFVISAEQAWKYGRGIYLDGCSDFIIEGVNVCEGNLDGATGTGAITLINCVDFVANVNSADSGGMGVVLQGCTDFTLRGRVTDSQFTGLVLTDCSRGRVQVAVVDANMADSGTTDNTIGIDLRGNCVGIYLDGSASYVSNVAAGQKKNLRVGAACASIFWATGVATSVRTGGVAIEDNSVGGFKARNVRGWVTQAKGQATINNPATTVVVNHGLAITPTAEQITLTFNSASAGVTRLWPSAITATQFTINADAAPTTSATIGWQVDTE